MTIDGINLDFLITTNNQNPDPVRVEYYGN